ncbi:hypothetical protein cyc_02443 [Cyclospora cayetanensis]|uniref:Uncharacterized protein n=1 Tax=Cyclospora cayetanensis TaxID=88456 RepID=A0A1D3D8N8_9EIME|nr:hypothetical protein cyc_02443 [Cyclospora cayetanensis]
MQLCHPFTCSLSLSEKTREDLFDRLCYIHLRKRSSIDSKQSATAAARSSQPASAATSARMARQDGRGPSLVPSWGGFRHSKGGAGGGALNRFTETHLAEKDHIHEGGCRKIPSRAARAAAAGAMHATPLLLLAVTAAAGVLLRQAILPLSSPQLRRLERRAMERRLLVREGLVTLSRQSAAAPWSQGICSTQRLVDCERFPRMTPKSKSL